MAAALVRLLAKAGRKIPNPFGFEREYVRPQHGDAAHDAAKMAGDMRTVGNDMRHVAKRELAKHGK